MNREWIEKLISRLEKPSQEEKKCLIGFDGYIDELYFVVRNRENPSKYTRYQTIEEFGSRIIDAAGKSADIEIDPVKTNFGGNGPILANALAALGYPVTCIGPMDAEGEEDVFARLHPSLEKISIGPASKTVALEFGDGKIMLGNLRGSRIGWEQIKEKAGTARLKQLTEESSLIGLVNWSGLYEMNEIMKGMYGELMLPLSQEIKEKKDVFIDLADPTARSEEDREELFKLLKDMSGEYRLTLGMNENEALKIGSYLGREECELEELGEAILRELGLYQVVIHTNYRILGFDGQHKEVLKAMHIENPICSTGAGDHFNSGFCMGILKQADLLESMMLGQAMASYYISMGASADQRQLAGFIRDYYEKEVSES